MQIRPNITFCVLYNQFFFFQETQDSINCKIHVVYYNLKQNPHPPALYHSMYVHNFSPLSPASPLHQHHAGAASGADLVNWGPQANIGMGPYTFAHIYLDQP